MNGTRQAFEKLLVRRWLEACAAVQLDPMSVNITWDIGPYPHFDQPRGFAVAVNRADGSYHIRFAKKTLHCQMHRADGLIRHEIGHIIDFLYAPEDLNHWARQRHVHLPPTDERRADAIAYAIWGQPIKYDEDTVQSTRVGVHPRPEFLGL